MQFYGQSELIIGTPLHVACGRACASQAAHARCPLTVHVLRDVPAVLDPHLYHLRVRQKWGSSPALLCTWNTKAAAAPATPADASNKPRRVSVARQRFSALWESRTQTHAFEVDLSCNDPSDCLTVVVTDLYQWTPSDVLQASVTYVTYSFDGMHTAQPGNMRLNTVHPLLVH
jgi:hypothetical protein